MEEEDYLTPHNIMLPVRMWEMLKKEADERNIKASEVIRESIAQHYSVENFTKHKHLAIRFKQSIEVFDILIILTSTDEYKDQRVAEFWLSFNDILQIKFNRWTFARQAISIFTKICRELRRPVEYDAVMTRQVIEGTTTHKLVKEGFSLYFETPVTHDILVEMKSKAQHLLEEDGFEEKLIRHPIGQAVRDRREVSRERILALMKRSPNAEDIEMQNGEQAGGIDDEDTDIGKEEGFETIE
jgi:hypothetical protein